MATSSGVERDAVLGERALVPGETPGFGGVRVGLAQVADAAMAELDEVAGGCVAAGLVIGHDPRVVRVGRNGSPGGTKWTSFSATVGSTILVPHGGVDDRVDLAVEQRVDGTGLDLGVVLGVDDHERHAGGSGGLVGAVGRCRRRRGWMR